MIQQQHVTLATKQYYTITNITGIGCLIIRHSSKPGILILLDTGVTIGDDYPIYCSWISSGLSGDISSVFRYLIKINRILEIDPKVVGISDPHVSLDGTWRFWSSHCCGDQPIQ